MKTLYPVSIVGAGPGDPELLTLKALRCIQESEAIVYDRLIPKAILDLIPTGTARFFAGKSCKQHVMTQDEINDLLVSLAKSGRKVVRLKGGDPCIFGRGGEEAEYLAQNKIAFEIVPGISSASGCSAATGIPLTHRGLATSVRYITGHWKNPEVEVDWKSCADPETTLVVYMGLANLPVIMRKLMENGLPADYPACAIQNGTTENQRVVASTLAELADAVAKAKLEPPTLLIIGKVVLQYPAVMTANQTHCRPLQRAALCAGKRMTGQPFTPTEAASISGDAARRMTRRVVRKGGENA